MSYVDTKIKAFRFGLICLCWLVCFHWTYNIWEIKAVVVAVLRSGFKNIGGRKKTNLGELKWNLCVVFRLPTCSSSCLCSTVLRFGSHPGLTGRQQRVLCNYKQGMNADTKKAAWRNTAGAV